MKEIIFKAIEWNLSNEDEDLETLYISGLTQDSKSVIIKVDDFTPFVQIELPSRIKWDKQKIAILFDYMKNTLNPPPLKFRQNNKYNLYHKQPGLYMFCNFATQKGCKYCQYFFGRKREIPYLGIFQPNEIKVHEQQVDPIIKFTASNKLLLGGWIKAVSEDLEPENLEEDETNDGSVGSTADYEMHTSYKNLFPAEVSDSIQPNPKILSWDIETYSSNHNSKLPDPELKANPVIQISLILSTNETSIKKYLLTLEKGYHFELPDTKILFFKTEKELLLGFTKAIQKLNPDILLGYNILKFDWNYLLKRADLLGILPEFMELGRINGLTALEIKNTWESSAYGKQAFSYVKCQGRMNLDLMPEIERNYKMDTYSLNNVSKTFLNDEKRDLPAKQLFNLYKFSELTKNYFQYDISDKYFDEINQIADFVFQDEEEGLAYEYYKSIKTSNKNNILDFMKEGMRTIGDYCIQDSVLVLKLLYKLKTLYNMFEMANIFCVPMSYLQTRGQQVKILAQVYRYTLYHNFVIPFKDYTDEDPEPYQGASVVDAIPGYYENVPTLDFASLYPSIIIAKNICHTTYIHPNDKKTLDRDCNVIDFEDHVGCSHDPQKRKRKADMVLCGHHRYRFRKVEIEKDKDGNDIRKNEGILPFLERNLLEQRAKVRAEQKEITKKLKENESTKLLKEDEIKDYNIKWAVLEAKQLAIKVSANSMYGTLGARSGPIPLIAGAASVTASGREFIRTAINYILKNFNVKQAQLVYGDSVTANTPILCRKNGNIIYRYIHELFLETEYQIGSKEYYTPNEDIEVYTDKGWTRIKKVIRHKTNKQIVKIKTFSGEVEVTTDHSLLDKFGNKIKPTECKIGDELLHISTFPEIENNNDKEIELKDYSFTNSELVEIPDKVLNMPTYLIKKYLYGYIRCNHYSSRLERAKFTYLTSKANGDLYKNYYNNKIRKIQYINNYRDYVYDLETDNHHFCAGIGKMVVHNTDSCMIVFKDANIPETFELAEKASKDVTALFPKPVKLEFECVYGKFLLLTKKRYVAYKINKEGKVVEETKKGVVMKRRDNTKYLKNVYHDMVEQIMNKETEQEVFYKLYDNIQKLFTLQINPKDLTIYMGVKDLISYAKTVELPDPSGKLDKKGNPLKITYFLDKNKKPMMDSNGKPYTTKDPLDPNLLYDNKAQLFLVRKMMKRGEDVPANTRLQYVYLDTGNDDDLQGDKLEDYTFFKDNKNIYKLKLDPLYYLEKQLINPITELIEVLYRKEEYKYEALEVRIENLEKRIFELINNKELEGTILSLKSDIIHKFKNRKNSEDKEEVLNYKNSIALRRKQLELLKKKELLIKFDEYIKLLFIKKSENLLDKIEKKYGNKKRGGKKYDKKTGMTIKDDNIMENILKYRSIYKNIVKQLDGLFSSVKLVN
jgi:DNA polymerase elongation subunit (family B)